VDQADQDCADFDDKSSFPALQHVGLVDCQKDGLECEDADGNSRRDYARRKHDDYKGRNCSLDGRKGVEMF
jgi:hypothetical protein